MIYNKIKYDDLNTEINIAICAKQHHLMIFGQQIDNALNRYSESKKILFKRYFHSDLSNQNHEKGSLVGQTPINCGKIALYAILSENSDYDDHRFYFNLLSWQELQEKMQKDNMTIEENCVRTWLFVRDIDLNYMTICHERKNFFSSIGLTEKTHYIASTGIESKNSGFSLDALAIKNLNRDKIQYLYAPTHLNPTYEYGVTFERGVKINFDDHAEIFISGTASINNKGKVLFEKNIVGQTNRMIENVAELLKEANATFADLAQIIVYLRDISDYNIVKSIMNDRFENVPKIIVFAPVCRPEWLIEMECIAIKNH